MASFKLSPGRIAWVALLVLLFVFAPRAYRKVSHQPIRVQTGPGQPQRINSWQPPRQPVPKEAPLEAEPGREARALAADQLFATLDTTTRRVWLAGVGNITVSDTVGFIRELPHKLVAAFRATLEETVHADLLLHVVDASSPVRDAQAQAVNEVLAEIPAGEAPRLMVWNKIDAAGLEPGVERDQYGTISRVFVSARTGAGMEELRDAIAEFAQSRRASEAGAPESQSLQPH
jgi:hypothetical protein